MIMKWCCCRDHGSSRGHSDTQLHVLIFIQISFNRHWDIKSKVIKESGQFLPFLFRTLNLTGPLSIYSPIRLTDGFTICSFLSLPSHIIHPKSHLPPHLNLSWACDWQAASPPTHTFPVSSGTDRKRVISGYWCHVAPYTLSVFSNVRLRRRSFCNMYTTKGHLKSTHCITDSVQEPIGGQPAAQWLDSDLCLCVVECIKSFAHMFLGVFCFLSLVQH